VPNYSYACTECGHAFDIYQEFSDDALSTCPQCQGRLRKKFSAVGVVFKGSGFYRTDSRSGNGSAKDGASKDGAGKESKDSSTSGDKTTSKETSSSSSGGSNGKESSKSSGSTTTKTATKAGASS